MAELPNQIKNLLYTNKVKGLDVKYEDFINMYCLIVVDNVIYHSDDEFSNGVLKKYIDTSDELRKAALPHAIIIDGKIIKNRYGYTN